MGLHDLTTILYVKTHWPSGVGHGTPAASNWQLKSAVEQQAIVRESALLVMLSLD